MKDPDIVQAACEETVKKLFSVFYDPIYRSVDSARKAAGRTAI
jgi:hypothetical protein